MISIIIPFYNQKKELRKCLDSILAQSYENYEVIIVDDCSTKKINDLILEYKKEFDDKLEFIRSQVNHGAPYTRNKGFKYSRGEYLLFCDADITLDPECLSIMLKTLKNDKDASYAYSSHYFSWKFFKLWEFSAERLRKMPYIHSTSLIRRSDFPETGWDESLKRLQDWDLWLTMFNQGHSGKWIDKSLFKVASGGTMSAWMPSFIYKVLPFLPSVRKYKEAVKIIKNKHSL